MKKKQKEKKHYKVYGFRLHDGTVELMKKLKGGISWNRYFYKLSKKDESRNEK